MPACRGPDDPDARGIDAPIDESRAHKSDRAGGVLEHDGVAIAVRAETVFDDESAEAVLIEPERVVAAFVLGKAAVAATGQDDDGRCRGVGAHKKRRERGNIPFLGAQGARCLVGPKSNWRFLRVRNRGSN